jgi:hypothetical protein
MLYDFLLGEFAQQRGSPGFAAQTYLDLARRTRDPRVARRAVELANAARMPELGLEAARAWQDADPASLQALQTIVVLLVGAKRVEETEPYLAKLLASSDGAAATASCNWAGCSAAARMRRPTCAWCRNLPTGIRRCRRRISRCRRRRPRPRRNAGARGNQARRGAAAELGIRRAL